MPKCESCCNRVTHQTPQTASKVARVSQVLEIGVADSLRLLEHANGIMEDAISYYYSHGLIVQPEKVSVGSDDTAMRTIATAALTRCVLGFGAQAQQDSKLSDSGQGASHSSRVPKRRACDQKQSGQRSLAWFFQNQPARRKSKSKSRSKREEKPSKKKKKLACSLTLLSTPAPKALF